MNQGFAKIIGTGQTQVGELWDRSLRDLTVEAARQALDEAGRPKVDAFIVANMLSGVLGKQENLAAYLADHVGLYGVETLKAEAGEASGGAAVNLAAELIRGGRYRYVLVLGVEKMTDHLMDKVYDATSLSSDYEVEGLHGATPIALNAMAMQRYMHEFSWKLKDFAAFPINAHQNAVSNPYAMFRRPLSEAAYAGSYFQAKPINMMDMAPVCDGAAALLMGPLDHSSEGNSADIRLLSSVGANDRSSLTWRNDPLSLEGAALSASRAMEQAELALNDISFFELQDTYSILAALGLEAIGAAEKGRALALANEGAIRPDGLYPLATRGGLKARGNPIGATGIYQMIDACVQLKGEAGDSQVKDAHTALVQNMAGFGVNTFTHLLRREG